jgi:hypothetical protein
VIVKTKTRSKKSSSVETRELRSIVSSDMRRSSPRRPSDEAPPARTAAPHVSDYLSGGRK